MNDLAPDWLAGAPPALRRALAACARGDLPANVALMQLLGAAAEEGEAEQALVAALSALQGSHDSGPAARVGEMLALWRASPDAWATVKAVFAEADHGAPGNGGEAMIARWAGIFDRLAAASPEAAVALYSLGRADLLQAATTELVALIRGWGLLEPGQDVLDIGCGIGRLSAAIAGEVGSVTGIDVAPAMIEAARQRCAGMQNVRFLRTAGGDLSELGDAAFDLVLAIDVFPYIVEAGMGLAARHVEEAARVLRPGGTMLIFNFSYRGDLGRDRSDLARMAQAAALDLVRSGTRDLRLWDGAAFELSKPSGGTSDDIDAARCRP